MGSKCHTTLKTKIPIHMHHFFRLTCLAAFLLLSTALPAETEASRQEQVANLARRLEAVQYPKGAREAAQHAGHDKYQRFKGLLKSKYGPANPDPDATTDGMCIAGFVCGLVGLLLSLLYIGLVLCVLGIVFGAIGMSNVKNNPKKKGRGLAVAGLILGILGLALLFVFIVASL